MLKSLKNLFSKKKSEEQLAGEYIDSIETKLSYCVDDDGNIFIDIKLKDYEPQTVANFAYLIANLSDIELHAQTINAIKNGFLSNNQSELYDEFLELVMGNIQENMKLRQEERQNQEEQPCIKPSDML